MKYSDFKRKVYSSLVESDIVAHELCHGVHLIESSDGIIFINESVTDFKSIEEARDFVRNVKLQEQLQEEIEEELYEELTYDRVAEIIREHYDVRVTDSLVESYVELAASKEFTLDPVVLEISKHNKLDRIVEDRIDFQLKDGSSMVLTEETYQHINKVFGQHSDIINYMKQSVDNFMSVVGALEEQ